MDREGRVITNGIRAQALGLTWDRVGGLDVRSYMRLCGRYKFGIRVRIGSVYFDSDTKQDFLNFEDEIPLRGEDCNNPILYFGL